MNPSADKFAPAKKLPLPSRKVPALAITGALLACLGIVIFGWLMAQKPSKGLVNQSAPVLVVVTLEPGSIKAAGPPQLSPFLDGGVDVKLELDWPTTVSMTTSRICSDGAKHWTRDGLRMESEG